MRRDRFQAAWYIVTTCGAAFLAAVVAEPASAQPTLKTMIEQTTELAAEAEEQPLPDTQQDALGRGTPRGAVEGFYASTRKADYSRAAEYLDLRRLPAAEQREASNLARAFRIVLDRTLWVDFDTLSDQPEGHENDGLPPYRDRVGQIRLSDDDKVDILVQRIPGENGVRIWKFSSATVTRINDLYEAFGYGPLGELLPPFFFDIQFAGFQMWQWIVLIVVLPLTVLGAYLITTPLLLLLRSWRTPRSAQLRPFITGPLRLILVAALMSLVSGPLRLGIYAQAVLEALRQALVIVAGAWVVLDVVDLLGGALVQRLYATGRTSAIGLLPPARKVLKGLIILFAGIQMLHSFGFNVTALLAGLGVGGIAVALAAQKTVENLIGGVALYANQPVRVGDFCRFGEKVGTVEEVGLYSTRVRTLERTVVTIPNSEFASLQLDNFSKRDRFWYHPTIGLRYETTPDQIRYVLVEIRKILYAHPRVHSDPARVRFTGFGAYSLDLEIFAYVLANDYSEFLEVAEDLNLRIMDIVAVAGSSFAFPSQTTYIENGEGLDRERVRAAEEEVRRWRERNELYLPAFPQGKIDEMDDTLDYPPKGSAVSGRAGAVA